MALNYNQTYRVLNYCSSPIVVSTKNESIVIPGGSHDDPGVWDFSIDEIRQINNMSKVFKFGMLWFDDDVAEDMYRELKIFNYEDILTDVQIEQMILNPSADDIATILEITDKAYFDRIYGVFMGMKNAGYPISMITENMLRERYQELLFGKTTTQIRYRMTKEEEERQRDREELQALKAQMKKILETNADNSQVDSTVSEGSAENVEPKVESTPKPTKPKTTRKTTRK